MTLEKLERLVLLKNKINDLKYRIAEISGEEANLSRINLISNYLSGDEIKKVCDSLKGLTLPRFEKSLREFEKEFSEL